MLVVKLRMVSLNEAIIKIRNRYREKCPADKLQQMKKAIYYLNKKGGPST